MILDRGYERREEAFQLSSGEISHDYIDAKKAFGDGGSLKLAAEALIELAGNSAGDFDAVGGLTMGADALSHAVAMVAGKQWFSVRKEAKGHGTRRSIEGSRLRPGARVLLVDDVVTTGESIIKALDAIEDIGATVVLAASVVDRGEQTRQRLGERGVPYEAVMSYLDLEIEPVGKT